MFRSSLVLKFYSVPRHRYVSPQELLVYNVLMQAEKPKSSTMKVKVKSLSAVTAAAESDLHNSV